MASARAILLAFIFVAIGLAKSGCAFGQDALPVAPDTDKPLGPGDIVSLEIVEDKAAPVMKRISDTGDLDVPYIGRVHAAGRSCEDVALQVKKQLEAKYYYTATVKLAIEQIAPQKVGPAGTVFVSGDVKTVGPQAIPYGQKLTVSGAIVKAGSVTQFGDLRKVKLVRKNKNGTSQTFIIDVKAVIQEGQTEKDMELQDGDSIFVPQRLFTM